MGEYTFGFDLSKWVKKILHLLALILMLIGIYLLITTPESKRLFACHTRDVSQYWTAYTGPWLHGSIEHLTSNSISILGLGMLFLVYFSVSSFWKFFLIQYIVSSNILFFLGDEGEHHIGASTWLYSLAAYLLTISLLSRNRRIKSMALIIALWYGTMWWGLLPVLPNVSNEGHIAGLITGILLAIWKIPKWKEELSREKAWMEPVQQKIEKTPNPYDSVGD